MPRLKSKSYPSWFRLEDYLALAPMSAASWYSALRIRVYMRDHYDADFLRHMAAAPWFFNRESFWDQYLNLTRDPEFHEHPIASTPIVEISPKELNSERIQALSVEAELLGKKLIFVATRIGDPDLKFAFNGWLKSERAKHPLPVKRSGPQTINRAITQMHFEKWKRYQILALMDLKMWTKVFQTKFGGTKIANLIFPTSTRELEDEVKEADKALKEALACIDLIANMAGETAPNLTPGFNQS